MLHKTHVLLRKELISRLNALCATEVKVYITILILVNPKTGMLTIPLKGLAARAGLSYRSTNRAVLRLKEMDQITYYADRILRESRITVVDYLSLLEAEPSSRYEKETTSDTERLSTEPRKKVVLSKDKMETTAKPGNQLIDKIAIELNEGHKIGNYRKFASKYPEPVIKKAFKEVKEIPENKIKRSRGALFSYLVKKYAEEK